MKRPRLTIRLVSLCLLLLIFVGSAAAAPMPLVNATSVGCNAGDLIAAITTATSGDTLDLTEGCTYSLTMAHNTNNGDNGLPVIDKTLTINGNNAIIERSANSGTPQFRIFKVLSAGNLTLNSITVRNGYGYGQGGGIDNAGTLTINNSTITGNLVPWVSIGTGYGAGIYNSGTVTVTNTTFSNNIAQTGGGALGNFNTATITSSTFSNNTASNSDGGAIFNTSALTITGTTFSSNRAVAGVGGGIADRGSGAITVNSCNFANNQAGQGGAIYMNSAALDIMDSSFTGNSATGHAGAIYNYYGSVTILSSVFTSNTASGRGGAIYNANSQPTPALSGKLTVSETSFSVNAGLFGGAIYNNGDSVSLFASTLSNNHAFAAGGAIFNSPVTTAVMTISNSTLTGNTSSGDSGAVYTNGHLTVIFSTVTANSAPLGGGIKNGIAVPYDLGSSIVAANSAPTNPDLAGQVNSLGYNVIGDTSGVTITGDTTSNLTDAAAQPLNLGVLQDNGGTTLTMALNEGSVAVGHGNCETLPGIAPITTDQRGVMRKMPCDVGAYESSFTPPPAPPTLISPSGTQDAQPITYTFNAVPNAGWYYLWVTGDSGHVLDQWYAAVDVCVNDVCAITPQVSYTPQNYQWWVQAWGESFGYTAWSDPLSFSFGTPVTPTQIAPLGIVDDTTPLFQWSDEPGLTWYNVWVSDPNGGGQEFWYEDWQICGGGVCSVEPLTISGGIYTWWVRGWYGGNFTAWSAPTYFQLPITAPTPTAPTGTITTSQPTFSWNHVPSAYWFYLWVTNDATGYVLDQWYNAYEVCVGGVCSVTPPLDLPDGSYTFWVQAWTPLPFTAGTYSPWSVGTSFTVVAPFSDVIAPRVDDIPVSDSPPEATATP